MTPAKGCSLIWCNERCFKPDHETQRAGLTRATRESGVDLVLFRKAGRFSLWLDKTGACPQQHYSIITSWREAKPCFEAIIAKNALPVVFIVLCESAVFHKRASFWASSVQATSGTRLAVVDDVSEAALLACGVNNAGPWSTSGVGTVGVSNFGVDCSSQRAAPNAGTDSKSFAGLDSLMKLDYDSADADFGGRSFADSETSTSGRPSGSSSNSDGVDSDGGGSAICFGEMIASDVGIGNTWENPTFSGIHYDLDDMFEINLPGPPGLCTSKYDADPVKLVRAEDGALSIENCGLIKTAFSTGAGAAVF
eukprot:TRINITY_DN10130_c0_g1_i1.p1 TRINITY_DN10130_c0_g1~~TRINITY_DN10130_c0_g1_i1.p1  ORF type:complete len:330 (+),score=54.52 TRINITY_DN10130_c0_g1_i1:66-992(+)